MNRFYLLIFISLLSYGLVSCSRPEGASANIALPSGCSFDDRSVIDTLANQRGTVVLYNSSNNYYIIVLDSGTNNRISPCNLPDQVRTDGTRVSISGTYREILFNDPQWPAVPFKLSSIRREN